MITAAAAGCLGLVIVVGGFLLVRGEKHSAVSWEDETPRPPPLPENIGRLNGIAGRHRPDGIARVRVLTSNGPVDVPAGLDEYATFGNQVAFDDLLALLRTVVDNTRNGRRPKSAECVSLCRVTLALLAHVADPASVEVVAQLYDVAEDRSVNLSLCIRISCLQILAAVGEKHPETRDLISKAVSGVLRPMDQRFSGGGQVPDWLYKAFKPPLTISRDAQGRIVTNDGQVAPANLAELFKSYASTDPSPLKYVVISPEAGSPEIVKAATDAGLIFLYRPVH